MPPSVVVNRRPGHRLRRGLLITFTVAAILATIAALCWYNWGPSSTTVDRWQLQGGCPVGSVPSGTACVQCVGSADCPGADVCVGQRCVPPCTSDGDCDGVCWRGACVPCTSSTHCPAGQLCSSMACVECERATDCPGSGQRCLDGVCRAACYTDQGVFACSGTTPVCDSVSDSCVECLPHEPVLAGVVPGEDAPPAHALGTSHVSGLSACTADLHPGRPHCAGTTCVACTQSHQCPAGHVCSNDACRPLFCTRPQPDTTTVSPMQLISGQSCITASEQDLSLQPCDTSNFAQWFYYSKKDGSTFVRHLQTASSTQFAQTLQAGAESRATLAAAGDVSTFGVEAMAGENGFTLRHDGSTAVYLDVGTMTWGDTATTLQARYIGVSNCAP